MTTRPHTEIRRRFKINRKVALTRYLRRLLIGFFPGRMLYVGIIALMLMLNTVSAKLLRDAAQPLLRIGFSSSMFTEVNENDARAVMKVWIMTVARERGLPVDPDPDIYGTVEGLVTYGQARDMVGFGIITPEYVHLSRKMAFDTFVSDY